MSTTTTSTQTETNETTETNAQQLTRLRRQRLVLAPPWADPAQVALGVAGLYAGIVMPFLLYLWKRR
ncbi:hypothetical protein [Streptomyces sp. NPDC048269]|uniref:hypothetical protein n=1 Tax=Streptomyces sp. NPDC048269 TaxID=3155753 RepID=UPI0034270829